jgi:hypothetical protein
MMSEISQSAAQFITSYIVCHLVYTHMTNGWARLLYNHYTFIEDMVGAKE